MGFLKNSSPQKKHAGRHNTKEYITHRIHGTGIHQGKSRWHRNHVLAYISPVLTYPFGDCAMCFDHKVFTYMNG